MSQDRHAPGPGLDGPGSPVTKRPTFCHVLVSRWRVGREEGRERHSQTVNIDLSLPDRGLLLGLESTHIGPRAWAGTSTKSCCVEPDLAGQATSNARGVNVKMTFSSAARSASVAERFDIPARSPSLPGRVLKPIYHHLASLA